MQIRPHLGLETGQ